MFFAIALLNPLQKLTHVAETLDLLNPSKPAQVSTSSFSKLYNLPFS